MPESAFPGVSHRALKPRARLSRSSETDRRDTAINRPCRRQPGSIAALGADRWTLGPELLIGKLSKKYVIGAFPNHQWNVGGSGDAEINLTTAQLFLTYLPGGGWNVGSSPITSYDHEIDEWTLPLNFTFGKTVIRKGRAWKLSMEINYFVEQPDAFGPEWFIGLNAGPVVKNVIARWFQ